MTTDITDEAWIEHVSFYLALEGFVELDMSENAKKFKNPLLTYATMLGLPFPQDEGMAMN